MGFALASNEWNSSANAATTATSPIEVLPDPVNFGSMTVGNKDSQTMRLSNSGTADLTVTEVYVTGAGFSVSGLSLPLTLSAGRSASFTSTFKPTAAGNFSGRILIRYNAERFPFVINLSGVGTTSTVHLTPNPTSLSFGNVSVGTTSTKDVKLTNTGNTDVAITNVSVAGSGFATSGGTGVKLTPNQSTNVAVSFDPKSSASVQGTLSITSNAPPLQITLTGQGTGPPGQHSVSLKWSPSTSAVAGYNVYRGTVSGGPYARLNGSLDLSTNYTDDTVVSGTIYYYAVTAVGKDNVESAYSHQVSAAIPTP